MSKVWSINNVDVNEFMQLINACKGNLYLVTDEGDRLNLKSTLCQLVGLARLIEGGIVANASLICENIEDEAVLMQYKLYRVIKANAAAMPAENRDAE